MRRLQQTFRGCGLFQQPRWEWQRRGSSTIRPVGLKRKRVQASVGKLALTWGRVAEEGGEAYRNSPDCYRAHTGLTGASGAHKGPCAVTLGSADVSDFAALDWSLASKKIRKLPDQGEHGLAVIAAGDSVIMDTAPAELLLPEETLRFGCFLGAG